MTYARPADRAGALRLHLNENTGGCSQAVVEAIRQITAEDVAYYPDYSALSKECAEYLGVREAQLLLTNGLDEGLLAATVSSFRVSQSAAGLPEAILPTPAFEMYSVFVKAAGGRSVSIPPQAGFEFQLREVCDALSERTRIVFLTNVFPSPITPTKGTFNLALAKQLARRHELVTVVPVPWTDRFRAAKPQLCRILL